MATDTPNPGSDEPDYKYLFNLFHMYLTPEIPPEDLTPERIRGIARQIEDYNEMKEMLRRRLR
jgi:hypothetical protein